MKGFLILFLSLNISASEITYEEGLKMLRKRNLDLKTFNLENSQAKTRTDLALSSFYPTLSLEAQAERVKGKNETKNDEALKAVIDLNLYNGGKDLNELEMAKLDQRKTSVISDLKSKRIEMQYFLLFQSLMATKESKKSFANAKKRLQKISTVIKKGSKSGLVSKRNTLGLQVRQSEYEIQLIELKERERLIQLSLQEMLDDKGFKFHGKLSHFHLKERSFDLKNSPKLKASKLNSDLSELEYKSLKSELFPKLDLEVEGGRLEEDDRIVRGDNEIRAVLSLSMPLFDSHRYDSVSMANIKKKSAVLKARSTELSAKKSLDSLILNVDTLQNKIHILIKKQKLLKENFRVSLKDLRYGQVSIEDLLESEKELLALELEYPEMAIEISKKIFDLEILVGREVQKETHEI